MFNKKKDIRIRKNMSNSKLDIGLMYIEIYFIDNVDSVKFNEKLRDSLIRTWTRIKLHTSVFKLSQIFFESAAVETRSSWGIRSLAGLSSPALGYLPVLLPNQQHNLFLQIPFKTHLSTKNILKLPFYLRTTRTLGRFPFKKLRGLFVQEYIACVI